MRMRMRIEQISIRGGGNLVLESLLSSNFRWGRGRQVVIGVVVVVVVVVVATLAVVDAQGAVGART